MKDNRSAPLRANTGVVATVGHELRTRLTSIARSLGLGAGGVGPPVKAKRPIDIALSNSDRSICLTSDVRDVKKIESGEMVFDKRSLTLVELSKKLEKANDGFA